GAAALAEAGRARSRPRREPDGREHRQIDLRFHGRAGVPGGRSAAVGDGEFLRDVHRAAGTGAEAKRLILLSWPPRSPKMDQVVYFLSRPSRALICFHASCRVALYSAP